MPDHFNIFENKTFENIYRSLMSEAGFYFNFYANINGY